MAGIPKHAKASCVQANVVVTVIIARDASMHSGAVDCVGFSARRASASQITKAAPPTQSAGATEAYYVKTTPG